VVIHPGRWSAEQLREAARAFGSEQAPGATGR